MQKARDAAVFARILPAYLQFLHMLRPCYSVSFSQLWWHVIVWCYLWPSPGGEHHLGPCLLEHLGQGRGGEPCHHLGRHRQVSQTLTLVTRRLLNKTFILQDGGLPNQNLLPLAPSCCPFHLPPSSCPLPPSCCPLPDHSVHSSQVSTGQESCQGQGTQWQQYDQGARGGGLHQD